MPDERIATRLGKSVRELERAKSGRCATYVASERKKSA
jgi:hypothetical protein